jgi:hypothetical protein
MASMVDKIFCIAFSLVKHTRIMSENLCAPRHFFFGCLANKMM